MFSQPSPSIYQSKKCSVTYGAMGHVDLKQPPSRGKPWSAMAAQDFIHKIDLLAPQECFPALHRRLIEQRQQPVYGRVLMTLGQLFEANFLNEHVKKGRALMLSQGRTNSDDVFSVRNGTLTMYIDKDAFERAGLTGRPYGAKGGRGLKPRWVVTCDLNSPSMAPGKRGLDRLLYACQHVFKKPLTWLFCNVDPKGLEILEQHGPTNLVAAPITVSGQRTSQISLNVPTLILASGDRTGLEETAAELYEWLSLVRLQSPRISTDDTIDPFLSRYSKPVSGDAAPTQICLLRWQGFFDASCLKGIAMDALDVCSRQQWVSINSTTFSTLLPGIASELTLLRPSGVGNEYLMWETKGSD